MKNSEIIKKISFVLILTLLIVSCKENEPRGDEFSWSPDGKKLAMVNVESKELLIIDLEDKQISRVMPIDSISGEKAKIYRSGWSRDGQYLLYAKSNKTTLEIFVYAVEESKLTRIDRIPIDEKGSAPEKVFVSWSPSMNRVIWLSWNHLAEYLLFSALPDGQEKKLLIKFNGKKVFPFPAFSPDGQWIVYSVYMQNGHKNNGLWKMKHDGSENQLMFPGNEITAFQWQPDGSRLAIVTKVVFQQNQEQGKTAEVNYRYKLSVIDAYGENERLLSEDELQIIELAWSPDGKQIAFFQQQDNSSDIWVIDLDSNQKVKLNFNKVQDFFGWDSSNQLFYTMDYPEDLVTETKEQKDARQLLEALRDVLKENLLVKSAQFQQRNQNNNIFAFTDGGKDGGVAYYRSSKPSITGSEIYCPVIQFSDGEKLFPARTKAQYVAAADECYSNQNYRAALDFLNHYWNADLTTMDFQNKFDVAKMISQIKIDSDSSHYKASVDALKDGTMLKTILTMRKLNQNEQADWLWDQLQKLIFYLNNNSQDQKDIMDEIYWSLMSTYSRYNEPDAGISDLDRLLQSDIRDSNLIAFTNYAQSILAIQDKQYELSLQKMESAIKYLSKDLVELDDIKGLLSLCDGCLKGEKSMMIIPVLQQTLERFPENKNVFQIYNLLGDIYLKQDQKEKALEAYQSAVVSHFDQYEIWDKILGIR